MILGIEIAGAGAGRLFGLDLQTVIQICAHLVNVGLLAFILAKLLYKPVQNFLARRTDKIKEQLDQAEDSMTKAKALKLQYERKLLDAERERDEILSEARKRAEETGRQILADAKKEADSVRERATANVEMEWERAQSDMRLAILDISAAMSEKFMRLAIDKETHDRLFAETMSELGGTTWKN